MTCEEKPGQQVDTAYMCDQSNVECEQSMNETVPAANAHAFTACHVEFACQICLVCGTCVDAAGTIAGGLQGSFNPL